jgi:TonB-linked SusC/RagA family outer membrane protein
MKRCLLALVAVSLLLCSHMASGQTRDVTGTVTDETGSPLPGVSVVVKGTSNGTVTDADGKFALPVPQTGATLTFSFIGLETQEIPVNDRTIIDVEMLSDVQQLSEVVVTAQGIERTKNELPYAAQKVQGEELNRTRDPNFLNSLSGKVSGVQIQRNNVMGGSTNVVIRGFKSLTGSNQALFVVDGVPIDNSNTNTAGQTQGTGGYDYGNYGADINPDDIESVNVLKGAAATALYGSRASNGVVMITTKRGSKKGIGVTLNTGMSVGSLDKSTFPEYQNRYGAGYGAYYYDQVDTDENGPVYHEDLPESDAFDPFFLNPDVDGDGTLDKVVPTSEDASYGAPFDPNLMVYHWDAFDPTSPNYNRMKPWVAAANGPESFFQTPVSSSHSIMLDGAADKDTYFKLGYTRTDDKGILPNSHLSKDFVNFGASYKILEKLTVAANINFTRQKGKGRYGTGYDDKNIMTNFRQWWQTNVDVQEQKDAYFRTRKNITWNWADPSELVPIYWDNPYWTRWENFSTDGRSRYFGNIRADYDVTDWLNIMGRISLDSYDEVQEERVAIGSIGVSGYNRFNRSFREMNYDLMLNANKELSEALTLRGVLGVNIRRTTIESIFAQTNGGLVVPRYYALANSVNALTPPTENFSDLEVDGVYANATVGLANTLFIDLALRRDQASSLPVENNVYYYPSASASFVFSELIGDNDILTGGKFRLNYAEVGGTAPSSATIHFYDKPASFGQVALFSLPGTRNNENLKPERTKSYEAGVEMNFFDDRVGFDLTLYRQNTVDQIIPANVSVATGYNAKFINAGNVQNHGIELSLFGSPVKTRNFTWNMNINWTRNRNVVKDLGGVENLQLGTFQGGVSINAALGQPYGTIRGSDFIYHDNGQRMVDETGHYLITTASNQIIGNVNPDWVSGISNTFKFKNVSVGFLLDMKRGGDVFSLDMYYGLATGLFPETAGNNEMGKPVRSSPDEGGGVILPGVKEDGTPNDIRVSAEEYGLFGYLTNPASAFVYDASYVKLREANITFSIPTSVISRIKPFTGIDLSIIGRNLWIIDKNLPYADPEDNLSSGNIQGYQVGSYPLFRTIGFNVRARF